jgi:UDP-2,3-diacylglucosamine hydrolase
VELYGKEVFLAHGDEFSTERGFRILRAMFHNRFLQRLLSMLHPRWSIWFGHKWAYKSMIKHKVNGETPYMGEEKEDCVKFAKKYLSTHTPVDCFVFGHRHIDTDISLDKSQVIFLGDWVSKFDYVVIDSKAIEHKHYVEGESKEV